MARQFANNAESTLASGISSGATSLTVQSGDGAEFPTTGDFTVRIEDAADSDVFELVTASARSTDTITISATSSAWDAGDKVFQVVAKADLDAFVQTGAATVGDLLDFQFARKTSTEGRSSTTTLANDADLLLALGASQVWLFSAVLFVSDNGGGVADIKIAFTIPSGGTLRWGGAGPEASATTAIADGEWSRQAASGVATTYGTATSVVVQIEGYVATDTTTGNLQLQWAQNTSDANATNLQLGSYILARRVV